MSSVKFKPKKLYTMKTKITILAAILMIASFASFATVLTVSNHPLGGSQYTNLTDAYNAAVNGDTLLLEGTDFTYGMYYSTYYNKSLTYIGAGFNTDKQFFKTTRIAQSYSDMRIGSGASGSSFFGIVFNVNVNLRQAINNLTFEDCIFESYVNLYSVVHNNLVFRNCIFNPNNAVNIYLNGSNVSSTVSMISCVFDGYIEGYNNALNTLLVNNCLFLSTTGVFSQIVNASVSNSIFMNVFPGGTTGCIYLNNICRVAGTLPPGGNTGSGNISNSDPLLVSYTAGSHYSNTQDYHLQAGSPCELAGSDGTDIGIHGGTSKFSESGEALIAPVVRSVQINNTIVAPNGTLDVDVTASKPTDE